MDTISAELQEKIRRLRSLYAERGLPEEWLYDILRDIHIWCAYSLRRGGDYAIPDCQEAWFDQIFSGNLLRIGRLQYIQSPFGGKIVVFRRNDELAVMAEDGLFFDEDGMRSETGWKSTLHCHGGLWTGNRICCGRAERKLTELDAGEWKIVLRYSDPMIAIHIPEDGSMDADACRASMKQAGQWFGEHDPDWKGFFCQSWLLNPVFRDFLPETSNIIQFQRNGILYPMISQSEILNRLHPGRLMDFVLEKQKNGFVFKNGGMFVLKEYIGRIGP